MTDGLQRLDGRTVRPNIRRERKLCIIPPAPETARPNVRKEKPRYQVDPIPESDLWRIYDSEGEVCTCPTSRMLGLLAALNGQDARERVCAV